MGSGQTTPRLQRLFDQAVALHQQGNLGEAELLYAKILRARPSHSDARHMLGVIRFQQGRHGEALDLIGGALKTRPKFAEALSNYGLVLQTFQRYEEALASYDKALAINPGYIAALINRGNVLKALKRYDESLAAYDTILAHQPDSSDALNNRANALQEMGRHDEALASYDRAVAIRPRYAEALSNRSMALFKLKRYEEALASSEAAIAIKPDHGEAHVHRGNVLQALMRHGEALASYERALEIAPSSVEGLSSLGNALRILNRYEAALASYDKALAVDPDHVGSLNGRGNALVDLRRSEEAAVCYRRALSANPYESSVHSNLIFAGNFDLAATAADHQAERARWGFRHGRRFAAAIRPHANLPDPDRRLRIGYVSSHFRHQAATYAFGGVITGHDRGMFEVVCYSDTIHEDDVTERIRGAVDKWHKTTELSDDALADLIRDDGIDILIDLAGHMRGHRLLLFARKPAPIQVTAWGEPTGTGLEAMDYLLADPVLVPAEERDLLVEQVVDLPNFLGYWVPDPLPEPGPLPAVGRGHITYGSFNRIAKVTDPVLEAWARILCATPKSRLVLKDQGLDEPLQRIQIHAVLAEKGVAAERVTLLSPSDRSAHFAAYREIDLALDPFPHGGGMTTLDALWMGVPVVSWSGRTISSRLAAASLTALGLDEFIAPDIDSYVELAVAKAGDIDALSGLRAGLRGRVADSAFGNCARYAHAVEAAYRQMWRHWCEAGEGRDSAGPRQERFPALKAAGRERRGGELQSFSQHGQDVFIYETFFKDRGGDGIFVDVGAYDGATFSNSLFFEHHLGWNGICIEPLPSIFDELRKRRRATCLNCAISDREGVVDFLDVDMPNYGKMYSGLAASYDERHKKLVQRSASNIRTTKVKLRTLASVLNESGVKKVDYLSIDTEGAELAILKSLDLDAYDIRVISVENNYQDPEIRNRLLSAGYRLVHVFAGFDELYAK